MVGPNDVRWRELTSRCQASRASSCGGSAGSDGSAGGVLSVCEQPPQLRCVRLDARYCLLSLSPLAPELAAQHGREERKYNALRTHSSAATVLRRSRRSNLNPKSVPVCWRSSCAFAVGEACSRCGLCCARWRKWKCHHGATEGHFSDWPSGTGQEVHFHGSRAVYNAQLGTGWVLPRSQCTTSRGPVKRMRQEFSRTPVLPFLAERGAAPSDCAVLVMLRRTASPPLLAVALLCFCSMTASSSARGASAVPHPRLVSRFLILCRAAQCARGGGGIAPCRALPVRGQGRAGCLAGSSKGGGRSPFPARAEQPCGWDGVSSARPAGRAPLAGRGAVSGPTANNRQLFQCWSEQGREPRQGRFAVAARRQEIRAAALHGRQAAQREGEPVRVLCPWRWWGELWWVWQQRRRGRWRLGRLGGGRGLHRRGGRLPADNRQGGELSFLLVFFVPHISSGTALGMKDERGSVLPCQVNKAASEAGVQIPSDFAEIAKKEGIRAEVLQKFIEYRKVRWMSAWAQECGPKTDATAPVAGLGGKLLRFATAIFYRVALARRVRPCDAASFTLLPNLTGGSPCCLRLCTKKRSLRLSGA